MQILKSLFHETITLLSLFYHLIYSMEDLLVEESEVDSELITDDDDSDSSAEEVSSSDQGWIITLLKS